MNAARREELPVSERRLTTTDDIRQFLMAGNAYVTIRSVATGRRYTYRVSRAKYAEDESGPYYVCVVSDETLYLGTIRRNGRFDATAASALPSDAEQFRGFGWFWTVVREGDDRKLNEQAEVWHEGRCGACGRRLTLPESIRRGLGPDCAQRRRWRWQ